ncbi:Putative inorganic phosphate cotransporter [Eumeta japonica]|uniref:Inorganic phosphate cotransporter n=1 Tax=Eumeta variegata TaxID=151549 RepID=A0A4C1YHR5_EUMVA|nr:Putative inorganic phosphate cotransporter [Eumeta japonica]
MRSTMSVAVLAMTTPTNNTNVEIYDWDKNVKGMVLSSFFWGYTLLQIPAGILAKKYGGHPLLLGSLIASGLLCLTLPTFAKYGGWMAVCAIRSVMGLAQACLLPSYHTLLGQWSPPDERTRMSVVAYTVVVICPFSFVERKSMRTSVANVLMAFQEALDDNITSITVSGCIFWCRIL